MLPTSMVCYAPISTIVLSPKIYRYTIISSPPPPSNNTPPTLLFQPLSHELRPQAGIDLIHAIANQIESHNFDLIQH